jgi:hypothetical protein
MKTPDHFFTKTWRQLLAITASRFESFLDQAGHDVCLKSSRFFSVFLAGIIFFSASLLHAQLINVDFNRNDVGATGPTMSGAAVFGTAGDQWNGISVASGTGISLIYADGSASTVEMTFTSGGGWDAKNTGASSTPFNGTAYDNLMQDYLFNGGIPQTITLSGLATNATYDLIVYSAADVAAGAGGGRRTLFSVNGGNINSSLWNGTSSTLIAGIDYQRFASAFSDSSGNLVITYTGSGSAEGDINGFQIKGPAPTVTITNPANLSVFFAPANVNIAANAVVGVGTVTSVQFSINGSPLGSVLTAPPFNITASNLPAGIYSINAAVAGNGLAGLSSENSSPVNIRVIPPCSAGFPDNFECREIISGTNISFLTSNSGATSEPGEPSHFSGVFGGTNYVTAGQSLWYSWTAPFSGGVVITANTSFPSPCLAVYTGDSFATFTRVASNSTFNAVCRLVFSAVAGTTYQIAVDAITDGDNSPTQGNINFNLTLTPPPPNDLFSNGTPISGPLFETYGSVIGASREPGEPSHTNSVDVALWPQTLWWSWTAPNNLGVSAIPVKLIAQGLQYQPNIGVYTGTSISNLTSVASTVQGPFNTRLMDFMALPGATYQIVLGGNEDYPTLASTNLGNYYLRVNVHALVLSLANLNATTNANGSVDFGVDLQVTNYGSASSSALRVLVTANSSQSLSPDAGFTPDNQTLLLTVSLPALDPEQGTVWHIGAEVPERGHNSTNITIFADYAQLQEQVGTNWFTLDQVFILADEPSQYYSGGGVILLDPGLTGSAFNPLTSVSVLGPTTIPEGSTAAYFGRARYASGDQYDFSNTVWTATLFSITTNGLFTTGSVTSNTPVTLDAKYASDAFTYDTPTNILILNLPPPMLSSLLRLSDRNFQLSLQGVPGRQHVIEATTNLSPPVIWSSLITNAAGQDGSLLFTDTTATNFSRRFYRAREN